MAEEIQVDVTDDGGSTNRLVQAFKNLASAAERVAKAEDTAASATREAGQAAATAAAGAQRLATAQAAAADSATLMQRAGAGASAGASAFARTAQSATGAANAFAGATKTAGTAFTEVSQGASLFERAAVGTASRLTGLVSGVTNAARGFLGLNSAARTTSAGVANAQAALDRLGINMRVTAASVGTVGTAAEQAQQKVRVFGERTQSISQEVRNSFGDTIQNITQQVLTFAAALGSVQIARLADQANITANSLVPLYGNFNAAQQALMRLNATAGATGTPLAQIGQATLAYGTNLRALNADATLVEPVMQRLAMVMVASTGSSEDAGKALVELAAAFKGGYTSSAQMLPLLERYPALANVVGQAVFGTGTAMRGTTAETNKLKAVFDGMGGSITNFTQMVLSSNASITQSYTATVPTIGTAWTQLVNSLTGYLGATNNATQVTTMISAALVYLSQNIGIVVVGMGLLAAAVAAIALAGLIASLSILWSTLVGLGAILTSTVGLFFLITGAVAGGLTVLYQFGQSLKEGTGNATVFSAIIMLMSDALGVVWEWLTKAAAQMWEWLKAVNDFLGIGNKLSEWYNNAKKSIEDYAKSSLDVTAKTRDLTKELEKLIPNLVNAGSGFARVTSAANGASNSFGTFAGEAQKVNSAISGAASSTNDYSSAASSASSANSGLASSLYGVAGAYDDVADSASAAAAASRSVGGGGGGGVPAWQQANRDAGYSIRSQPWAQGGSVKLEPFEIFNSPTRNDSTRDLRYIGAPGLAESLAEDTRHYQYWEGLRVQAEAAGAASGGKIDLSSQWALKNIPQWYADNAAGRIKWSDPLIRQWFVPGNPNSSTAASSSSGASGGTSIVAPPMPSSAGRGPAMDVPGMLGSGGVIGSSGGGGDGPAPSPMMPITPSSILPATPATGGSGAVDATEAASNLSALSGAALRAAAALDSLRMGAGGGDVWGYGNADRSVTRFRANSNVQTVDEVRAATSGESGALVDNRRQYTKVTITTPDADSFRRNKKQAARDWLKDTGLG